MKRTVSLVVMHYVEQLLCLTTMQRTQMAHNRCFIAELVVTYSMIYGHCCIYDRYDLLIDYSSA